ncbi:heavy metal translocatin [Ramaria rubella]|nr:heavy metal translocatin [Ramaria rubella]
MPRKVFVSDLTRIPQSIMTYSTDTQTSTHERTILHVDNLHCDSCVASINSIVELFSSSSTYNEHGTAAAISDVNISLLDRTVSFTHPQGFDLEGVLKQLDLSGFDARIGSNTLAQSPTRVPRLSEWRSWLHPLTRNSSQRKANHREICEACRSSEDSVHRSDTLSSIAKESLRESRFALEGVTCSSCTSAICDTLSPLSEPGVRSRQVTLLPPSVLVIHDANVLSAHNIRELIENIGYGAELITSKNVPSATLVTEVTTYKVIYSILGMTCASCVSSVTRAMEGVPGTKEVLVDLIGNMGSVVVQRQEDAELVRGEIEDVGFDCSIVEVINARMDDISASRTVTIKVEGMVCWECVEKVNSTLDSLSRSHALSFVPITLDRATTTITYSPRPPTFTLRYIRDEVTSLGFTMSVIHVDSLEERATRARIREQHHILIRFAITFFFAIPTFVVAVVGMSLLSSTNPFREHLEMPVWGNASRATVILFALSTPVQFGVGWVFYDHTWKSLKGVWRKRRAEADWRRVWFERLFRWGSMDTLVSLGTSTGYFASLAIMILDIKTKPTQGMMGGEMGWFDSSVFLVLFILAGRYLESVSKQRTGDAIATLSSTKPSAGLLYSTAGSSTTLEQVDFLEIGDVLLVPTGASPPLDAVLTRSSPKTTFNESSLTGEARPVLKGPGDEVFAGTTNAGPAAAVVTITHEVGRTMLDDIVGVVRDAMGKKAGIERLADVVTGYFVPFVVAVAALTFGVWTLRGYLGSLPAEWADSQRGRSWALFAVQFGVAVLVVACPCGIGLAAPTAQMVGVGLAAQHGILSNGGGEAFQTISSLNTVVLDKTGTLTTSKFTVSDEKMFVEDSSRRIILAMLRVAEQASTHPLAIGVREWCEAQLAKANESAASVELVASKEIPGRGLLATLIIRGCKIEVAIGNEELILDISAEYLSESAATQSKGDLLAWQMAGKSVVLLSARLLVGTATVELALPLTEYHTVLGIFGVHDPPRGEASTLVAELRKLHMDVWMISGDNTVTATTVAQSVGIDKSHVVAGALPADKQAWVKRLQNGEARTDDMRSNSWWNSGPKRTIVAFCGDGINDAPAIAQADVGLAMGGGSNVAISTADFCLLNSSLLSILTIHHLARATRRKIVSNFVWACLYNVLLMPLAAGAFYPLDRTTLPPVWGSAAMAMSSVSVVVNSLFLRWLYNPPRAVRKWNREGDV